MTSYSQTLQRFGLSQKPIREYKNGFSLHFEIGKIRNDEVVQ